MATVTITIKDTGRGKSKGVGVEVEFDPPVKLDHETPAQQAAAAMIEALEQHAGKRGEFS